MARRNILASRGGEADAPGTESCSICRSIAAVLTKSAELRQENPVLVRRFVKEHVVQLAIARIVCAL
jgi:hypothetical protein